MTSDVAVAMVPSRHGRHEGQNGMSTDVTAAVTHQNLETSLERLTSKRKQKDFRKEGFVLKKLVNALHFLYCKINQYS